MNNADNLVLQMVGANPDGLLQAIREMHGKGYRAYLELVNLPADDPFEVLDAGLAHAIHRVALQRQARDARLARERTERKGTRPPQA